MSSLAKLYLKVFLLTGPTYGLLTAFLDKIFGKPLDIEQLLLLSFLFGFFMSLFPVSIHKIKLKNMGIDKPTDEDLTTNQKRKLTSRLDLDKLTEALNSDIYFSKFKPIKSEKGIKINTGINWLSWGEKIDIQVNSSDNGLYSYAINSKPKVRCTLLDYGKNLQNVNRIEELIENISYAQ